MLTKTAFCREAPGFLGQTLRIWRKPLSGVQVSGGNADLPPPRSALSSQSRQVKGKTRGSVTRERRGYNKNTAQTFSSNDPVGLNILRLNENKILHQNNKRDHSLRRMTEQEKTVMAISSLESLDRNRVNVFIKMLFLLLILMYSETPFGLCIVRSSLCRLRG